MRSLTSLVALCLLAATSNADLIWSDEFDTLDVSKWEHVITMGGGGNWEFEMYWNNRSNSYVKNSVLYIKPTLTADRIGEAALNANYDMNIWGSVPGDMCTGNAFFGCERQAGGGGNILPPVQSARLRSTRSLSMSGGKLEVKAKMPRGDWLWPAIWLLPKWNAYGNWPASGEIDMVESRGNANGYPGGVDSFGSTLHWGTDYSEDRWPLTHSTYKLPQGDFNQDFHVFGFNWTTTRFFTYIDNETNIVLDVDLSKDSFWNKGNFAAKNYDNPWAGRGNNAPFDQEFFLILNLAVGGIADYFPDDVGGKPWKNADPHAVNAFWAAKNQWYPTWKGEDCALQIDWIRVYN